MNGANRLHHALAGFRILRAFCLNDLAIVGESSTRLLRRCRYCVKPSSMQKTNGHHEGVKLPARLERPEASTHQSSRNKYSTPPAPSPSGGEASSWRYSALTEPVVFPIHNGYAPIRADDSRRTIAPIRLVKHHAWCLCKPPCVVGSRSQERLAWRRACDRPSWRLERLGLTPPLRRTGGQMCISPNAEAGSRIPTARGCSPVPAPQRLSR